MIPDFLLLLNLDRHLRPPFYCIQNAICDAELPIFIPDRVDHMRACFAADDDNEALLLINKFEKDIGRKIDIRTWRNDASSADERGAWMVQCCGARGIRECLQCRQCAPEKLAEHLVWDHGLQRCPRCCLGCLRDACTQHSGNVLDRRMGAWVHITKDHRWVLCPECRRYVEAPLSSHRRHVHAWLECAVCDVVVPDAPALVQHQQSHRACEECHLPLREEEYPQHMAGQHGRRQCPFSRCGKVLPTEDFDSHLEYHRAERPPPTESHMHVPGRASSRPSVRHALAGLMRRLETAGGGTDPAELLPTLQTILDSLDGTGPEAAEATAGQESSSQSPTQTHGDSRKTPEYTTRRSERGSTAESARPQSERGSAAEPARPQRPSEMTPLQRAHPAPEDLGQARKRRKRTPKDPLGQLVKGGPLKFVHLVNAVRRSMPAYIEQFQGLPENRWARVAKLRSIADQHLQSGVVTRLIHYRALVLMAQTLDETGKDRQRIAPSEYKAILKEQKLPVTAEARRHLGDEIRKGRNIRRILGPHPGFICFLAMADALNYFASLADELPAFHRRLQDHERLWRAGNTLLHILDAPNGSSQIQFKFEQEPMDETASEISLDLLEPAD